MNAQTLTTETPNYLTCDIFALASAYVAFANAANKTATVASHLVCITTAAAQRNEVETFNAYVTYIQAQGR